MVEERSCAEADVSIEDTVNFWDLAGCKKYKRFAHETDLDFLARINDPTKWLYGSELRDEMLLRAESTLPRFAHLSRKAFIHYAGERYNPHEISIDSEITLRFMIKGIIEYKVEGRVKGYDWEYIDNFLMKVVSDILDLNLPFDMKRIHQGPLPEFKSLFHDLENTTPH